MLLKGIALHRPQVEVVETCTLTFMAAVELPMHCGRFQCELVVKLQALDTKLDHVSSYNVKIHVSCYSPHQHHHEHHHEHHLQYHVHS